MATTRGDVAAAPMGCEDLSSCRDQATLKGSDVKVKVQTGNKPEEASKTPITTASPSEETSPTEEEFIARIPKGLVEADMTSPAQSTIPGGPHPRINRELREGGYAPWLAERIAPGIRTPTSSPAKPSSYAPPAGQGAHVPGSPAGAAGAGVGGGETMASPGKRSSGLGGVVVAGGMVGATVVIHASPVEDIEDA